MQKPVFENTTVYDSETLIALSETVSRIVRKQTFSVRKAAMLLAGILCCGIGIYCIVSAQQKVLGLCLIPIGLLAGIRSLTVQKLKVWGGKPAESGRDERRFLFLDDGIRLVRGNGSQKGCLYNDIMLHAETETFFLLMQNFQTAFLVRKDGFTEGNPDDFRQFLIKKTACRQFEIADTTDK